MHQPAATPPRTITSRILDAIEWVGNKLPDPAFLFVGAAVLVVALSAAGSWAGWAVAEKRPVLASVNAAEPGVAGGASSAGANEARTELRPVLDAEGRPVIVTARSLLSREGGYWALSTLVSNFTGFAPLGLILVCMFGIGVAERVGMFGALLKWLGGVVPASLLAPSVVFLGIMSNITSDAGYLVLPPLAAAMYAGAGRSPLAGVAASFAGIAAGFSANLLIAAGDAMIAGITQVGARVIDPAYEVNPTCNWYFLAGSTGLLVAVGWGVTAWIVEPRLSKLPAEMGGPARSPGALSAREELTGAERRALRWSLMAFVGAAVVVAGAILIPGAPMAGPVDAARPDGPARWTQCVVPIIFIMFLAPGLAYGRATGEIRTHRDVSRCFVHAMASMAPVITMYFFAAQFVAYLNYSNLGRMVAFVGGEALVEARNAGLPPSMLMVGVVGFTLVCNFFIGSMSAKWTMLAPILVPMLMMVGVSPELSQGAYRVGDSVTNIVTPLNPYMIIILGVMQKYAPRSGMGSLIALMTPYAAVFAVVWTLFLLAWMWAGVPLGPGAPLHYTPAA